MLALAGSLLSGAGAGGCSGGPPAGPAAAAALFSAFVNKRGSLWEEKESAPLLHYAIYGCAAPAAALLCGLGAAPGGLGTLKARPCDGHIGTVGGLIDAPALELAVMCSGGGEGRGRGGGGGWRSAVRAELLALLRRLGGEGEGEGGGGGARRASRRRG